MGIGDSRYCGVVIKITPGLLHTWFSTDLFGDSREFRFAIGGSVEFRFAMKTVICNGAGHNRLRRQFRMAHPAKSHSLFAQCSVNFLPPPVWVPKFKYIIKTGV